MGLAAYAVACASGASSDGASSDGGDDSTIDGASGEGGPGSEASSGEGGGTSLTKACGDNAAAYCAQLSKCSFFLLESQYGDQPTCTTQLGGAYCNNIVTAKGSGWTGDGLEACVTARTALSCSDFLYGKPAPSKCTPTGALVNGSSCLFDSQCGSGYCHTLGGAECGTCLPPGQSTALCATNHDCESDLVCLIPSQATTGTCTAPVPLTAVCNATTPCATGVVCLAGKCAQPGAVGAACSADAGGIDCDYNLGAYCDGMNCSAITVAMISSLCGGSSPPAVCFANGACQAGFCVAPAADGQPCDGGLACTIPSTCSAGVCSTPSAAQCP